MKIGMILDSNFPPDPRVENEAKALLKKGFDVYLFCLSYNKNYLEEESISNIKVRRYYCGKITYKLSALAYTFPFYHWILKNKVNDFIKKNKIDVIHVHDMQIARTVWMLKEEHKLPIVVDLHENRPEIMEFYTHVNSFLGKLLINPEKWKKYEAKFIKTADHVIVVTDCAKKHYLHQLKITGEKFNVVPNVVHKEFYEDYSLNEDIIDRFSNCFNFLYLGDTGMRRGTLDIINAAVQLKNKNIDFKIIIVGKSKDDKTLKEEATRKGLSENIIFEGWQDFKLFQSYLTVADVGLSCLHRNIHHDTTYANKVFQYASFGVPIIASDCTAQKEIIEDMNGGLVYKANNINELASCMEKLYQDADLKTKLGENGKKSVANTYNWEHKSKDLIHLYQQIEKNIVLNSDL